MKNKNPQYNNTGSDYELTLGRSTVIEECDSYEGKLWIPYGTTHKLYHITRTKLSFQPTIYSLPQQLYDFVPINKMEQFQIEDRGRKTVDVCGIIKSADTEFSTLQSKTTGKDMYKVCRAFADNKNKKIF